MTVGGALAVAVGASGHGRPDHMLIARLALLALASFEAVTPLASAARELSSTLAAGRRILQLTNDEPVVRDPEEPAPAPGWPFAMTLEGIRASYPHQPHRALDGVSLRLVPGARVALVGPAGRARPRS